MRRSSPLRRLGPVLVALAVALAACGADDPPASPVAAGPAAVEADAGGFPDVEVLAVGDGSPVSLPSLAGDRPVLLWFWAPH
jgi:hypothetical protein